MAEIDLQTQRISVSAELHESLPQLFADRSQLQQLFLNLILIAIDAMRSVRNRPRLLRIRSEITQQSSTILVTVEDSGTGIDNKNKRRIFDPFFTTKSGGRLAICRSIIEVHEGQLWVTANKGRGAVFQFTIPVDPGNVSTAFAQGSTKN